MTPADDDIAQDLMDDVPANHERAAGPITPGFVAEVSTALETLGVEAANHVRTMVEPLHAADMADLLNMLHSDDRAALVALLGADFDPEVLSELDTVIRDEVVDALNPEDLAAAVSQLDTDDAIYVLEDLDEDKRQEVLDVMPAEERVALEEGLSYPEDSAGRLARRELVAVPQFWTVGQTIDFLRTKDDIPEDFHEIFIVDPRYHPIGTVALSRMLRAQRTVLMQDVMAEDLHVVPATWDQEEVAYLFKQYNLMSVPVSDTQGRLIGVITIDDVVDVIGEEADEDLLALAGVSDGDLNETAVAITRTRLPWLLLNLGTAFLAALVIALFDGAIEELVALAVLMPIVTSMGGNAGTQTMTVTVRALASRGITASNLWRVVNREVLVNFLNGITLAVLVGGVAGFWFQSVLLGVVLGAALIINLFVAGFFGVLIPITLERFKIDPAVASTVFLTMLTDVVGFFAFLGLAAWIIL